MNGADVGFDQALLEEVAEGLHTVAQRLGPDGDPNSWLKTLADGGFVETVVSVDRGGSGSLALGGVVARQAGRGGGPVEVLQHLIGAAVLSDLDVDPGLIDDVAKARVHVAVAFRRPSDLVPASTPTGASDPRILVVDPQNGTSQWHSGDQFDSNEWLHPHWRDILVTDVAGSADQVLGPAPRATSVANTLAAAYMNGLAEGLLDLAVEHAKVRHQFGQPIGAFQAIKHKLADAHIDLLHTRALIDAALKALDADASDGTFLAAASKDRCGRAAQRAAERSVQTFGGLGFTSEHAAHRYLKTILRLRHFPEPSIRTRQGLLHESS
jgi:hypothetical protein